MEIRNESNISTDSANDVGSITFNGEELKITREDWEIIKVLVGDSRSIQLNTESNISIQDTFANDSFALNGSVEASVVTQNQHNISPGDGVGSREFGTPSEKTDEPTASAAITNTHGKRKHSDEPYQRNKCERKSQEKEILNTLTDNSFRSGNQIPSTSRYSAMNCGAQDSFTAKNNGGLYPVINDFVAITQTGQQAAQGATVSIPTLNDSIPMEIEVEASPGLPYANSEASQIEADQNASTADPIQDMSDSVQSCGPEVTDAAMMLEGKTSSTATDPVPTIKTGQEEAKGDDQSPLAVSVAHEIEILNEEANPNVFTANTSEQEPDYMYVQSSGAEVSDALVIPEGVLLLLPTKESVPSVPLTPNESTALTADSLERQRQSVQLQKQLIELQKESIELQKQLVALQGKIIPNETEFTTLPHAPSQTPGTSGTVDINVLPFDKLKDENDLNDINSKLKNSSDFCDKVSKALTKLKRKDYSKTTHAILDNIFQLKFAKSVGLTTQNGHVAFADTNLYELIIQVVKDCHADKDILRDNIRDCISRRFTGLRDTRRSKKKNLNQEENRKESTCTRNHV